MPKLITNHLEKLKMIYESMDRAYKDAAVFYDFDCRGCQDNCCTTYFFHYTLVEYLYLLRGFWTLEQGMKEEIMKRAMVMCDPLKRDNYLCPLNLSGRCLLYPYRAMICRLHGLPFEVERRDGQRDEGPGCAKFEKERRLKGLPYRRIERTPFYTALANLEREIRAEIPNFRRFKKTIAEMIRDGGEKRDLARILESLRE
jgi:Fe-S-cluster containining protein